MQLIIECGATKSDWSLIEDKKEIRRISAAGINISTMNQNAIDSVLRETAQRISGNRASIVHILLYIPGVMTGQKQAMLSDTIRRYFPNAVVAIQTDLIAAAHAACGHGSGIAVILGTGSNSCQWENGKIVKKVNSGGFILGDEGGAATLGKLFIADFIKGLVPDSISEDFSSRHPSDYAAIISKVYSHEESPSGYLGSLAPFIMEHYVHPYIKNLVDGNFRSFIRRTLKQYDTDRLPVSIVGGFGYALREIFTQIAQEEGLTISRFIEKPIDGLVEYHTRQAER